MLANRPRKHLQLSLDVARRPTGHGGWQPGAGLKRKPGTISHGTRAAVDRRDPQHVTPLLVAGVGSIARDWLMTTIHAAIERAHKPAFRIVEFNVLANHLHLIVEAGSTRALATGMQGLEVRLARRLDAKLKRGELFASRYHVRALKTPREVRNALRYVLCNRKHHSPATKFARRWFDPSSSAAWFTGWATPIDTSDAWKRALLARAAPTAPPTVWLLTTGWKRRGLLRFDEAPA